jgi:hypothetical protein
MMAAISPLAPVSAIHIAHETDKRVIPALEILARSDPKWEARLRNLGDKSAYVLLAGAGLSMGLCVAAEIFGLISFDSAPARMLELDVAFEEAHGMTPAEYYAANPPPSPAGITTEPGSNGEVAGELAYGLLAG